MKKHYFSNFYQCYLEVLGKRLDELNNEYQGSFRIDTRGIMEGAENRFNRICFRTLVVEFQVCDKMEKLGNGSVWERVECYQNHFLANNSYRQELMTRYPVLKECCESALRQQIAFTEEVYRRLYLDKSEIQRQLLNGRNFHEIVRVEWEKGDFHQDGKSTIVLWTDLGEAIYYKPRSLDADLYFCQLLDELEEQKFGIGHVYANLFQAISCSKYGWVKRVAHIQCETKEQYKRFYFRIGMLLGISYLLGCHDFHFQNLIAHGEYPVLVDLENIFTTDRQMYRIGESDRIDYCVLSSNLLPVTMLNARFSAVFGGGENEYYKKVPAVSIDEDGIRIVYRNPQLEAGKNLPGEQINVAEYSDEILSGFCFAYDFWMDNKGESESALHKMQTDLCSRYLLRNTQFYHNVLEASYHPALLGKHEDREYFIAKMCKDGRGRKQEVMDLIRGDIPYFYRYANKRELWGMDGISVADFFKDTAAYAIRKRLENMNESDREIQRELIRLSLKMAEMKPAELKNGIYEHKIVSNGKTDWCAIADKIAHIIEQRAMWNKKRTKAAWIQLKTLTKPEINMGIKCCDRYFYEGTSGIAVFLRKMNHVNGKYGSLCQTLEQELFEYTDHVLNGKQMPLTEYTGMFCGEASLIFTYLCLYQITGLDVYLDYAKKHAEIVVLLVEKDQKFDLLYGNAGAMLAFCLLYEATDNNLYLEYAKCTECALRKYIQTDEQGIHWQIPGMDAPYTGVAHGNSGFLPGYGRLWKYTPHQDRFEKMIRGILQYENFYIGKINEEESENGNAGIESWCHGKLGMLSAYRDLNACTGKRFEECTETVLAQAESIIEQTAIRTDFSLCHGNMGNLLMLMKCESAGTIAREKIGAFYMEAGALLQNENMEELADRKGYGLMSGIAGIGMGCLMVDVQFDDRIR